MKSPFPLVEIPAVQAAEGRDTCGAGGFLRRPRAQSPQGSCDPDAAAPSAQAALRGRRRQLQRGRRAGGRRAGPVGSGGICSFHACSQRLSLKPNPPARPHRRQPLPSPAPPARGPGIGLQEKELPQQRGPGAGKPRKVRVEGSPHP